MSGRDARLPAVCLPRWRRWSRGQRTSNSSAFSRHQRCRRLKVLRAVTMRHRAFFVGSEMRGLAGSGQLDYVPISLEEVPRLLTSGRLPIDVALLQVSPPDARGFVSLGVSVDLAPAVLSVARSGYRRGQSSNAAHPRRELRASRPLRCAGEGRCAGCRVSSSEDRRDCGARRALYRLNHRRRFDAADRTGPRPK